MGFRTSAGFLGTIWCALILPSFAAAALYYHPIPQIPGAGAMYGEDVTNDGIAVGLAGDRAFRYTTATGSQLLSNSAGTTFMGRAYAVSADGSTVVGGNAQSSSGPAQIWTPNNKLQSLSSTNPQFIMAHGISDDGTVIAGDGMLPQYGVRWTDGAGGTAQGLALYSGGFPGSAAGVSGDGNYIVGSSGSYAVRWHLTDSPISLGMLPGLTKSAALATNHDGSVVVGEAGFTTTEHAWRWTSTTGMQDLGKLRPTDTGSIAEAVSADGNIIVGSSGSGDYPNWRPWVWDPVNGMRDLNDLLITPLDPNVYRMYEVRGVSPDGTVFVGSAIAGGGTTNEAFVVSAVPSNVPEPASLGMLMVLSAAALSVTRRRHAGVRI